MKKIEIAAQNIRCKIEYEEKNIEEMRQSIKNKIDSKNIEYDVCFIASYARRMEESAKKLVELRETEKMLRFIANDD